MKPIGRKAYGSVKEQLDRHIQRVDGHWLWTGFQRKGYGRVKVGGKSREAHRVAYEVYRGAVPYGQVLHHVEGCPYKHCINPWHLVPMSQASHLRQPGHALYDGINRTHCPRGHPYTPDNLVKRKNPRGRECAECNRQRARRSYIHSPRIYADRCPQGHPFTPENTGIRKNGYRRCRACDRERSQRSRERRANETT